MIIRNMEKRFDNKSLQLFSSFDRQKNEDLVLRDTPTNKSNNLLVVKMANKLLNYYYLFFAREREREVMHV